MNLRSWLFERRITQREIVISAYKIGIFLHQSNISNVVNGNYRLSERGRDQWRQVLKALGMTREELARVDILNDKNLMQKG